LKPRFAFISYNFQRLQHFHDANISPDVHEAEVLSVAIPPTSPPSLPKKRITLLSAFNKRIKRRNKKKDVRVSEEEQWRLFEKMKEVVHFAEKAEENADDKVEEGKTKVFFLFRVI
jgi:hypothetical protein